MIMGWVITIRVITFLKFIKLANSFQRKFYSIFMEWIDYLIMALFAAAMIGIAVYTRSRSKSVNDFLLAGKKGLNGWMSAFSYGTTYFSAVIFITLTILSFGIMV